MYVVSTEFSYLLGILLMMVWGSFMGAAYYRIPLRFKDEEKEKLSLWLGRSRCPHCHHILKLKDLMPIFSFLFLRGRCRYCFEKIGHSYFFIELYSVLLFVSFYYFFKNFYIAIFLTVLAVTLTITALIDLKHFIIPDELLIILLFIWLLFIWATHSSFDYFSRGLFGCLIGIGLLLLLRFLYFYWRGQEGIGLGDIKLVGIAGLYVGWMGIPLVLLIGALLTLVIAIPLLIFNKKFALQSQLPFGPGLTFGFFVTFLLQLAKVFPL